MQVMKTDNDDDKYEKDYTTHFYLLVFLYFAYATSLVSKTFSRIISERKKQNNGIKK